MVNSNGKTSIVVLAALLMPFIFQPPSAAQVALRRDVTFACRWTDDLVTIDGKADEKAWSRAQTIDKFSLPWLGADSRPAKTRTAARLLWDRTHLYFFAEMEDADLFGEIKEQDGMLWHNDVFELFFKPARDKSGYYDFQVNAANARLDMFLPNRAEENYDRYKSALPFQMESAVVLGGTLDDREDQDKGWSVEGRIPWRDFLPTGGRPAVDETWQFALCRYDYALQWPDPEISTCAPLTKPNFHWYEDYAPLRFVGPADDQKSSLPRFQPCKTSRVVGSPDPPKPFRVVKAYSRLPLMTLICIRYLPGSDQMLLLGTTKGRDSFQLLRATDAVDVDTHTLLFDFDAAEPGSKKTQAYDIEFHPQFLRNGYIYIGMNGPDAEGVEKTKIVRFTMQPRPPYRFDPASAKVIIEWPSDGHDGAAIVFGHDGMMYVTSGDGTSDSDGDVVGQRLDLLLAKVLRIDVDHSADGKAYSVPPDNPFVGFPEARPETWAYGFRNPWRMTVDQKTGHIWVGNNGQDLWEQIYLIQRGANYGWSVYEGSHPFYVDRQQGPTPIVGPTLEHHHTEARSLTGGCVYYGQQFPELTGAYVYGDYSTGRIWAARHDGQQLLWHREIADTLLSISYIGADRRGELVVADYDRGDIYQLERNPQSNDEVQFPRQLSQTGLFHSVQDHLPQPELIAYSINVPGWHDGAVAERFLALPASAAQGESKIARTIGFDPTEGWNFPDRTVLVQSLALELEAGNPASRRWVETRLLTLQKKEWAGYSYLWNDEQTEAHLVEPGGTQKKFNMQAGRTKRQQTWHVPSRSECMACHSRAAGFLLGLTTAQMNRFHKYGGVELNQLRVLEENGLFRVDWEKEARKDWGNDNEALGKLDTFRQLAKQREVPETHLLYKPPAQYARFSNIHDDRTDLRSRARSYLHVNCANCHTTSGGGNAQMLLRIETSDKRTRIIDQPPLHGHFGLREARLVAPGAPHRSVINYRMSTLVGGRMPRVGSHQLDPAGLRLVRDWIASMDSDDQDDPVMRRLSQLIAADDDSASALLVELLSSSDGALAVIEAFDRQQLSAHVRAAAIQLGVAHENPLVEHLFERFLSEDQRVERLGTNVDPQQILRLTGDPARGRELFLAHQGLVCLQCHKLEGRGHDVGPNLVGIGKRYSRGELLQNLLEPSSKIDEKYATHAAVTQDGLVHVGILASRSDQQVVLRQASGKQVSIPVAELDQLIRQAKSLMPDQMLQDLTAQQAADLVAFLKTL